MIIPNINQSISLEVQNRIDNRISDLFIQTDDNKCKPYVCLLYDIFVTKRNAIIIYRKFIETFIYIEKQSIIKCVRIIKGLLHS